MKHIIQKNNTLQIEQTIKEAIILTSEETTDIHTIIIEKNCKAVIVELYQYDKEQTIQKQITLKEHAQLEYVRIQDNQSKNTMHINFELKANATCMMHNFEFGQYEQHNFFTSKLNNEASTLLLHGLVKLKDTAVCNNHFDLLHQALYAHSDIVYKHTLDNHSKALFQAKTVVQNSALYSKAFQNSNTLLLDNDATIFTQPHLEIEIDELQASHGATTGSLDKEALLYLQSRGIQKSSAKKMLLKAFENELLDKIDHIQAKEYVENYKRGYDD